MFDLILYLCMYIFPMICNFVKEISYNLVSMYSIIFKYLNNFYSYFDQLRVNMYFIYTIVPFTIPAGQFYMIL